MTDASNPFIGTREGVDADVAQPQARNRLWWERMPMTYAPWEADERVTTRRDDLRALGDKVLAGSPFLREQFDFGAFAGRDVLDLGCGSGVFSCLFAEGGAHATAVDLTQTAVDLARQTAKAFDADVAIARMDAEHLAFAADSFDFIYSWGVLHHTSNMANAVAEAGRVLKPGGRGMMMVYHRHSIVYYLLGLYWLIAKGKLFSGHTLESVQNFYTDGYFHRYLTRREIVRLLQHAGLTPERISVTQYQKKILPLIPSWLDTWLKARFGMCLVAEFRKP